MSNTNDNTGSPSARSSRTPFDDPVNICKEAREKARSVSPPNLDSMTYGEIQDLFYEIQVKKFEAELQNKHLRSLVENYKSRAQLLSTVTENMLDMVVLSDLEGSITFAGGSYKNLGYDLASLMGKNILDFVHPEDLSSVAEAYSELVSSGNPSRVEYRCKCRDGSYLWLETRGYCFKDEKDNLQGIVFNSRDITERMQAEHERDGNEEKYRELFDNAPVGIFRTDSRGNVFLANHTMAKILGFSSPQQAVDYFNDLGAQLYVSRERRDQFIRLLEKSGYVENFEYEAKTHDGNHIWLSMNAVAIPSGEENSFFIEGFTTDITARKKAEENLKESEERFRVLSEASFEGIVIHENGIIIDVNKTFTELFGYEYDQIIGMNVLDLAAPECRDLIKQNILSDFEGAYEATGLRKDGSTFPGELRGRKITYKGRKVRITAGRDLSEQKKTEQELRRSEEKYRILFENANEPIYVTQDGKVKFVNPQAEKLIGFSKDELIEKPFIEFLHPEDRDMVLDRHKRRISGEDLPSLYTHRIINSGGEVLWVELSTTLFNWEDRPATLNFLRDITQQKKLEARLRQAQKMEAIGTLAGGIAHDFNNILASVLGYTELSIDEVEKGSLLHQNLSQVLAAGNRAKDLVKQILALSRQEDQEIALTPIVPLVKESVKLFRSTFPSWIEIRENILPEQAVVQGDPAELHQVIVNLATNAKQALRDETGRLEFSVEPVSFDKSLQEKYPEIPPGNYVRIAVTDTGRGISEQYLDKIFDPYFTTGKTGTGTGLGLSVVSGIVKNHSGHITVSSEPGKGSTFNVYLPLAEQEQGRDTSTRQFDRELPAGNESILLVEDEKSVIDMELQVLENLGYQVTSRTSSMEALEVFRANPSKFDLIVTDMTMPKMTGNRLALQVKKLCPDIPVILCTGFSEKIDDLKREETGVEGILIKPASRKDLAETVRKVLDGNQLF